MGDSVAYNENEEIKEALFLCSSQQNTSYNALSMLGNLINKESDLKYFCKMYKIQNTSTQSIFT